MDIQFGLDRLINLAEKSQELLGSVPIGDAAHDLTCHHIECGIQTGCTVALVIVCPALDLSRSEREHRLSSIQSLDLSFLVHG